MYSVFLILYFIDYSMYPQTKQFKNVSLDRVNWTNHFQLLKINYTIESVELHI